MLSLKTKRVRLGALAALLLSALCISQAQQSVTAPAAQSPGGLAANPASNAADAEKQAASARAAAADSEARAAAAEADAAEKATSAATAMGNAADKLNGAVGVASKTVDNANQAAASATSSAQLANDAAARAEQAAAALRKSSNKTSARKPSIDDFVPCLLDADEEFDLRSLPNPSDDEPSQEAPLDAQEAAATAKSVVSAAATATKFPPVGATLDQLQNAFASFSKLITAEKLQGVPRSEVPVIVDKAAGQATAQANITSPAAISAFSKSPTDAAKAATQPKPKFDRPDDVSCSFSLMDWHETSDVFGRRVANDYVALQVTVRNLNANNEFLIHDVQIAVDTGVSPSQFGRFQAGRDKLIVRAVAQRGQFEDRRNRVLNILEMMSNIAAGASGALTQSVSTTDAFAGNFSTAVEIFQGPFINGFVNIFPDHTIEHINHINDLTFSASTTSKTIVPTKGSVPLVTFLKERPLEQLPFAHCGNNQYWRTQTDDEKAKPSSIQRDFCTLDELSVPLEPVKSEAFAKAIHYSDWKPAALHVLESRVYVVIAGIHIQEVPSGPAVQSIHCPELENGSVNISALSADGSISCTLTGTNLDKTKVAKARLDNGKGAPITVTFTGADDGNSATITFKPSDAAPASGDYELYLTDSTGKDTDTKQKVTFAVRNPQITSQTGWPPASLASTTASLTVYLDGKNLDLIKTVSLATLDGKKTVPGVLPASGTTPDTGSIKVTFSGLAGKFAAMDQVHLTYTLSSDTSAAPKQNTLTGDPTSTVQ